MTGTLGQRIAATLRTTAQAFAAGDQVAPCIVLGMSGCVAHESTLVGVEVRK